MATLCVRSWGVALLAFGLVTALGAPAWSQLTTEVLIGDSVSDVKNAKYSDIGEAIERYNANDILAARTFLERAVAKDNKLPPVDVMLAKMHFVTGKGQAGLAALDAAVRDIRTDPEPYLLLADQALATGQSIAALALYDKGIELTEKYDANPKRKRRFVIRARAGRAAVLQQWQDWKGAEADLQVWLAESPEEANAHSRMGVVQFMLGKATEGLASFTKAKELDKNQAPPYVAAATMYQQLGNTEEARKAFERAYTENKTDRSTLISLGQWLLQTGQTEKATSLMVEARKALPGSYEILLLSGLAARMGGDVEAAEQFFSQALAAAPTNRDVYNQLALLLIGQDDPEKKNRALGFAQANAQMHGNNAEVAVTWAWVLYQMGRANEANEAYQKAIRMGPLTPDSKYLVAKLLVDQKRPDVAKQILEKADENYSGIFVMKAEADALLETLK